MYRRMLGCAVMIWGTLATGRGQTFPAPGLGKGTSEHVVFFSGNVMLDDGSAPSEPARIDRVCDGRAHFEAWTDDRGRFSFKVSARGSSDESGDASQPGALPADVNRAINSSASQYSMPVISKLRDCELMATLAGYRSERVSMAVKSEMDDFRVGTIFLHPLSRATSLTVSATTLAAPSSAKKAYEKGLEAMRQQKWGAAATAFCRAVKIYPKFAVAWYQLGLALQRRNQAAAAVEAWQQSRDSDPHYLKPYENLTIFADQMGDWADSEKYSRLWIQLDPEDFPAAYLFNAVANARLGKPDDAERAARTGLRLDRDHRIPRLSYVLGLLLMDKHQYSESAQYFRDYLEFAPNANDAAMVRQQLPRIESLAASK